jgi:addiction module HigA family antidote
MTTMNRKTAEEDDLLPIPHPGETLKEDFMVPLALSAYEVAKAVGATPITISLITRGKRAISAEMALRLGRYTGTGPEFWQNLQSFHDLDVAKRLKGPEIDRRVLPLKQAA